MRTLCLALLLVTAGCSTLSIDRRPASQSPVQGKGVLTAVIRKTAESEQFCPTAKAGDVCLMTWQNAIQFCRSQNGHLPSAREISELLPARGSKTLEVTAVNGAPPPGYYLVEGTNPDGQKDGFYLNHSDYQRKAEDDQEDHLIWTATTPPKYSDYAHVYYNKFGGGGGDKEDHLKSHPNAVICVR